MGSLIGASGGKETFQKVTMTESLTPSHLAIFRAEIPSWCHPTARPRSIVDSLRLEGMFVCALLFHPIYTVFLSKLT